MRVAFFGNHTVGVHALAVLAEVTELVLVVAHPPDPEDGVRYQSVYEFARDLGCPVIRGKARDAKVMSAVTAAAPDLVWVTDYRYLLPTALVSAAPLGAVNLHPSLLPLFRGRASINWAILKGESRLGLTAHFIDEGMDTGDIIEQIDYELAPDQDVGDALNLLYPLYEAITRKVLGHFQDGTPASTPQDHRHATQFGARKARDGQIDWSRSATDVQNLVRAVARPYPGAFTFFRGQQVQIWAGLACDRAQHLDASPGTVLAVSGGTASIACNPGALLATEITDAEAKGNFALHVGEKASNDPA